MDRRDLGGTRLGAVELESVFFGTVGIVCSPGQRDRVRTAATSGGIDVPWIETSLEGAIPLLQSVKAVALEWPADGPPSRHSVLMLLRKHPRPAMVIIGAPGHDDLFALAKGGVDAYFPAFTSDALRAAAVTPSPSPREQLRSAARANLGSIGVKDAQKLVRMEMFHEAMVNENGNRHAAARVLRIDRRYILKMVKDEHDIAVDERVEAVPRSP